MSKNGTSKKFVLSRNLVFIFIIIGIPLLALIIWCISGFVGNNIKSDLASKFEIEKVEYIKQDDITDFNFVFTLTDCTYAKSDSTGSVKYKAVITNHSNTTASSMTMKICVADYWTHYVSDAKSVTSINPTTSGTTKTGSISSIAYSNKNGWGLTKQVSQKPNVYVYLSYTFVDESSKKSTKSCVVEYKFSDIFTGAINQ